MTKQQLRQDLLKKLRQQPEGDRRKKSLAIGHRLRRLSLYRKSKLLLCYAAFDGEVETQPLLKQILADGKRVGVPVILKEERRLLVMEIRDPDRDLKEGPFGIPEPARLARRPLNPKELDLLILPGVAFDANGRRLGRGGGYFDRFLSRLPADVPRVGLAFRFQVVKKIPWETHDQPVSAVITEEGTLSPSRKRESDSRFRGNDEGMDS